MKFTRRSHFPAVASQHGFSMIEVLVTLLIISLAMLGAVGLQAHAMRLNQAGEFRSLAVFLVGDLAERMEANRAAAVSGQYVVANSNTPISSANNCAGSPCSATELAANDLSVWENAVAQALPQSSWTITQTVAGNPSTYTIVVSWVDRRTGTNYATTGTGETFSYTATRTVFE